MMIRPAAMLLLLWAATIPSPATAQIANDDERPKVAVVLGGGGAHAIVHLGVLEELERQQVQIDLIVGTGLGGVIGGLYASGMTTEEIREFFISTDWEDIFNPDTRREDLSYRRKRDDDNFLIKYRVGIKDGQAQLPAALIPNEKLARLLQSTVAHTKGLQSFDDLPIAFRTVTMDLLTGEEIVLNSGSLDRAMLATLTAPGTLPPVRIDGRYLVTGSLLNNIPVDVARQSGADVIIVVDVGPYLRTPEEINSVFGIVGQVSNILQRSNSAASLATDFSALEARFAEGAEAAIAVADQLAKIRVSNNDYQVFLTQRQTRRTADPVISEIVLNNDSSVDDALILAQLNQPLNTPLDKDQLNADLRKIYGIGAFQTVDFNLQPEGDNAILQLRTIENRSGNRFWRFGISGEFHLDTTQSLRWGVAKRVTDRRNPAIGERVLPTRRCIGALFRVCCRIIR
jgi:NTE family protein